VDRFVLDKKGQCYKDERDKLFSRMGLNTNLVELRTLK
jgi:hypothetical protein